MCRIKTLNSKCENENSRLGKWGRTSKFTERTKRKLFSIAKGDRKTTSHALKSSVKLYNYENLLD